MCGIVGFTGSAEKGLLHKMNETQVYRGPDDEGYFTDDIQGVNLAMRRLSIIDLHDGHQPMSNHDETIWIVFNGEIFNAQVLRKELEKMGYSFKTKHSDTEVLIYMYKHYGNKMVEHLNGMFAFVIFDKEQGSLFAARDQFGIKPLYYSTNNEKFAFASEMKSLFTCPWISKELDKQSVFHYFSSQTVPAPNSIIKGIKKLPAGNYIQYKISSRQVSVHTYWQPPLSSSSITRSLDLHEFKSHIKEQFICAVNRWSQSDVEVACSLSGGIDSSAIVAALASNSTKKIKTFTVGFKDEPDADETEIARIVANKWDTEHHEIFLDVDDILLSLETMAFHLDEPYAGGLPSWFVYEAMSKHVKVAMTGTGGDELFGNYGKWRNYEHWRDHFYKLREYIRHGGNIIDAVKYPYGCLHYPYFSDGMKKAKLFLPAFSKGLGSSAEYIHRNWPKKSSVRDSVAQIDLMLQLPEEFLLMTDRFSMKFSVEARTPFLDKEFAELILSTHSSIRTSPDNLKYLFTDSVSNLLPVEVLKGRKKGFILPLNKWLKLQLREKIEYFLSKKFIREQGIFQEDLYEKIALPFYNGQHNNEWQLWNLLMFQLWYQKVFIE